MSSKPSTLSLSQSPFGSITYLGSKCVTICLAVSLTTSHAVDLPIPNIPASVLYSILLVNFQIFTATLCSTQIVCLKQVPCLAMWGCTSLHIIVNVLCDIRKFSLRHLLQNRPRRTISHYSLQQSLHKML